MATEQDRYDAWYSEKLWSLLPEIYRAEDSDDLDRKGPLREVVDRIGAQAAIVRRSIDRLWEDQSIETCDDWVIDYLGELLATNLVASLDARGRRLDVAKTIYYRRRKGTVGLLEQLATDITGWSVRVVEGFHRLSRTRHGLDPAIGLPAAPTDPRGRLQLAQRLVGPRTRTGAGGFADLRNTHGALLSTTAFDEFFHTADVRRGRGLTGWHNIPHVSVFVWRLKSFPMLQVTPVPDTACAGQYTFDPTGRDIPLWSSGNHPFGDQWVSPTEEQVPGAVGRDLLRSSFVALYSEQAPRSLAVHRFVGGSVSPYLFVPPAEITQDPRDLADPAKPVLRFYIDPERGRIVAPKASIDGPYRVDYHYAFSSEIGAGPYVRRDVRAKGDLPPTPVARVTGGGPRLQSALPTGGVGTAWIDDSLTYTAISDVSVSDRVELHAKSAQRPLVRLAVGTDWTFTGAGGQATLVLDGLFICGGDVVLRGSFDRVTLTCCTLDPGTWRPASATYPAEWARAADHRVLSASQLRIEGRVRTLIIERSIVGPIVDLAGNLGSLTVRDSIVQAVRPGVGALSVASGDVTLSRSTVLGTAALHRADVSECILSDIVTVDDTQHGCVRFSAWVEGSVLPQTYESVTTPLPARLFVSRDFGQPAFAQLRDTVSDAITAGAEDGSEMGAFAREKTPIKERSLLIKYQEYLPLGLEPLIVHVT